MLSDVVSRERLMGPEVFLATKEEANKLLNNIRQRMDELRKDAELLNRTVSAGEGESEKFYFTYW
jgi:hypothetical protein